MSNLTCPSITTSAAGLSLSRIVAGMWRMNEWNMTPQQRLAFIEQCLELGVSSFDHATSTAATGGSGVRRGAGPETVAAGAHATGQQCGIKLISAARPAHTIQHYDTSASHILASAENSLRQLGTDHLDLLLIHRPDPLMNFDEIAETFQQLRAAGKVLHFGVSNFSRHQFDSLNRRIALATNQVEFSPLFVDAMYDETFDGLQDLAWRR